MQGNLYCDQTTPWQGVYFCTNTVKVGAVLLTHCCVLILVVGIIIDVFHENTSFTFKKRALRKLGPQILVCFTTVVQYRLLEIGICKRY